MDRLLHVDLSRGALHAQALPEPYRLLGGRALTSAMVMDSVDPLCDPLGRHNRLVWAPGLLAGTTLSSSGRLSVGCKSPLTGGIKEANAGGETGLLLAQAGYRAVVVSGAAAPGAWWVLVIDAGGPARLEPAPPEILGAGTFAAAARLFALYGRQSALAICGPTGERRMGIAGIANTDREGRPARLNARGGVGAVMGAKGLKAVVVRGDLKRPVPALDPAAWRQGQRGFHRGLQENPATAKTFPEFGTAGTLEVVQKLGGLPTRNFACGTFAGADALSGVRLRELILARGGHGLATHACMTGCAIRCSNVFPDEQGREVASSMEYETNALLGANLGIDDLDAVARFTYLCNDLGCDTIETGVALGVAMEAGVLPWGNAAAVARALDVDIRTGTPLGLILGAGAAAAGRVLGVRRVPVVKNQALSAYDPRAIKGNGVTYVTSPMGGDHTAGNTIAARTDHLNPADKVPLSRDLQINTALLDSLGFCSFVRGVIPLAPAAFAQLYRARTGVDHALGELRRQALDLIRAEVAWNRRAGLGPETDRLPEWMATEPLPPHGAVFDVPAADLARIWEGTPDPPQRSRVGRRQAARSRPASRARPA